MPALGHPATAVLSVSPWLPARRRRPRPSWRSGQGIGPAARRTTGLLAACLAFAACSGGNDVPRPASEPNLLQGHLVRQTGGVIRPDQSADGILAPDGDSWDTPLTTILRTPQDNLEFDLGEAKAIDAAFIQADNNDTYTLAGSLDGQAFTPFWVAPAVQSPGVRARNVQNLHARARYVRVTAAGGDGAYSLADVQVFAVVPKVFPTPVAPAGRNGEAPNASTIWLWGLGTAVFLLLGCYGSNRRALLFASAPALATWGLISGVLTDSPKFNDADISLLRAVTAALALFAIVRDRMKLGRASLVPARVTATMGMLAVAGVACFYNLGRPQFFDMKLRQPSYVHNYDMRVYYPVAKYFHELKYDGLYLASVASYVDNHPGTSLDSLANVELRDLTTHEMRRVKDIEPQIDAVRQRFSSERWSAFCEDMLYFQETMGRDYFSTMSDHGGNATPVWFTIAHTLFRWTHAGNGVLLAAAWLDPLLLLLLGWGLARAFGLRTAFLCLLLFGANDYYMFGTNWAGATLRHDWMVALGLGAAALKRQRFALGGALLAYGGLIRAFPALAVFALLGPPLWWLVEDRRRLSRWPTLTELRAAHGNAIRAMGGALATVAVAVVVSSVVLSPAAWPLWVKKASVLSAGDHVNHLSLRTIASVNFETGEMVGNWFRDSGRVAFFGIGLLVYTWLTVKALRERALEVAAMLGLLLIPVFFYPANYYFHVVFLLPLLATTEGKTSQDRRVWVLLCLMCIAEYATTNAQNIGRHFMAESFILMATYLGLLLVMVPDALARLPFGFGKSSATGT